MRFSTSKVVVVAFALALAAVGCGDDDGGGESGTGGAGTGGTGGGGTGGGGTGGSGGTGVTMCGGTMCAEFPEVELPDAGMSMFPIPLDLSPVGCCAEGDVCGVGNSSLLGDVCLERDQVGEPSTECPTETALIAMLPGCCRPDGKCGLLAQPSLSGMSIDLFAGCVERTELATAIGGGLLGTIAPPTWAAMDCTYVGPGMDGGTGNDAGE